MPACPGAAAAIGLGGSPPCAVPGRPACPGAAGAIGAEAACPAKGPGRPGGRLTPALLYQIRKGLKGINMGARGR